MLGLGKENKQTDMIAFAIYDSKGETYGLPQLAVNSLSLIREYELQLAEQNQNNFLFTHPEDYTIFKIGEYTRKTAKFVPCTPESVIGFHEIKASVMSRAATQHQQNQQHLRPVN